MDAAKATTRPIFEPTNANIAPPSRSQAQKHQLLSQVKKETFLLLDPQISPSLIHQHWTHLYLQMTFLQFPDQVRHLEFGNLHPVPWSVDPSSATVPHRYNQGWIDQVLPDSGKLTSLEYAKNTCFSMSRNIETYLLWLFWRPEPHGKPQSVFLQVVAILCLSEKRKLRK